MARATRSPDARGQNFAEVTTPPTLNCYVWVTAWRKRGAHGTKRCCWPPANEAGPHHLPVFRIATPGHDLVSPAPEGSELRCNHAGGERVMHHTKIDRATTLAIGCAAGVRPSGRFVASGCEAASKRPSTATGQSAKMRRGDFSAQGRNKRMADQRRLARNLLERRSLFAGADSKRVSLAPFLIDSSLLFRTRPRSPRGDRIGLLLQLRQPGRAWRDDLRSLNTIFRKSCHRHLFRAVDPVPGSR